MKLRSIAKDSSFFMTIQGVEESLKVNLAYSILEVYKIFKENEKKNSKKDITNSIAAIDIVKVSQMHIKYVTFWMFKDMISGPKSVIKCKRN